MKLKKYKFRDIDNVWVLFDKDKDIKKINKLTKNKFSYDPILGVIYIDHEMGISIRILGNVYKDKTGYSFSDEFIDEKISIIRCNKKINFDATILSDLTVSGINNTSNIKDQIDLFYQKKAIVESRKMTEIDDVRHKYFPDDIQLYNVDEKGNEELVWGRIEDCSLENNVVVCNLLSDSIFNEKYVSNSLVIAKVEKKKKETNVVIKSTVRKKEKNAE